MGGITINTINKYALRWLQLFNGSESDNDTSLEYGVKAYPTKFILDKDLTIVGRFVGAGNGFYEKLDALLEQM